MSSGREGGEGGGADRHLRVLGVAGGGQERRMGVGSKGGCGTLVLRAKALPHAHLPGTRAAVLPRRIVWQGLGRLGAAAPLQQSRPA